VTGPALPPAPLEVLHYAWGAPGVFPCYSHAIPARLRQVFPRLPAASASAKAYPTTPTLHLA
jgi:hypothetical protein